MTFENLSEKVRQWSNGRNIIRNSTPEAQLKKLEEERQETLDAIRKIRRGAELDDGDMLDTGRDEVKDGLGDMLVCIINAAAIVEVDPVDALEHAYQEIKDRTGELGEDGIFYKDEK